MASPPRTLVAASKLARAANVFPFEKAHAPHAATGSAGTKFSASGTRPPHAATGQAKAKFGASGTKPPHAATEAQLKAAAGAAAMKPHAAALGPGQALVADVPSTVQRMDLPQQERGRSTERQERGRRKRYSSVDRRHPGKKKTVILFGEATFDFACEYALKWNHRKYLIIATEYRSYEKVLSETQEGDLKALKALETATQKYRRFIALCQTYPEERAKKEIAQYEAGNPAQVAMAREYERLKTASESGSNAFGAKRVKKNIELLEELGVVVLFGVDATDPAHWDKILTVHVPQHCLVDLVQWNDPHGDIYGAAAGDFENLLMTGFFKNIHSRRVLKAKITVLGFPYLPKPQQQQPAPVNLVNLAGVHMPTMQVHHASARVTPDKYTFKPQRTIGGVIDPLKDYNQLTKFVFKRETREAGALHIYQLLGSVATIELAYSWLLDVERDMGYAPSIDAIDEWIEWNWPD